MNPIRKSGLAAVSIALAVAGWQLPRFLHAGDRGYENPFATTAPSGWQLKNPDATYAIASDICPGLPASALATQALSTDPGEAKSAIDQLRDEGPAGLDALLEANNAEVAAHRGGQFSVFFGKPDNNWPKIRAAIDAVAGQRDAYASGLYWYTDFAKAQAASRASGKPILSLRLLGNLNDEYSCANSRFFRTVLYANAEVSKELREKFILHWQSVRPVPVITIDFGDGRKIRRTITGNSIHYVLTAEGKVVDGIPGLYGPKAFLRALGEAEKEVAALSVNQPSGTPLEQWHMEQVDRISHEFENDCQRLVAIESPTLQTKVRLAHPRKMKISSNQTMTVLGPDIDPPKELFNPTTADAAPLATSKVVVEKPNLVQYGSTIRVLDDSHRITWPNTDLPEKQSPANITDVEWQRIAGLHGDDAALDQASQALMAAKTPDAATAGRRAMSKMYVETPLIRTMRNFQRSVAEDTVRNEYLFHLQIHRWLADPVNANLADDVAALNKRVYAELFLTPDSDPWLGLVPADTYSALDDDGVCH